MNTDPPNFHQNPTVRKLIRVNVPIADVNITSEKLLGLEAAYYAKSTPRFNTVKVLSCRIYGFIGTPRVSIQIPDFSGTTEDAITKIDEYAGANHRAALRLEYPVNTPTLGVGPTSVLNVIAGQVEIVDFYVELS